MVNNYCKLPNRISLSLALSGEPIGKGGIRKLSGEATEVLFLTTLDNNRYYWMRANNILTLVGSQLKPRSSLVHVY